MLLNVVELIRWFSAVRRLGNVYRQEVTQWQLLSDPKQVLALFLSPDQLLSMDDSNQVSAEKRNLIKLREHLPRMFLFACAIAVLGFIGMIVLMSCAAAANG